MTTREVPGDTEAAVELLSTPPTTDDLDDLLEATAPRRRSKLTVALVVALVFVAGFLAGSLAEKLAASIGEAQSTTADEAEGTTAVADAGPAVTGHVLMLDEGVVYVEREDGATVKVRLSDGTVVGISESGQMEDLVPGDAVIVQGDILVDGTVDAVSIQQSHPRP